jgi:hypothetical protein
VSLGTRQRNIVVTTPGDGDRACIECPPSDTRQRSSLWAPLPVPLPSVLGGTRKRIHLCRVPTVLALGKGITSGPFISFFAECTRRHSTKLASLPSAKAIALAKKLSWCLGLYSLPSAMTLTLNKVTKRHGRYRE